MDICSFIRVDKDSRLNSSPLNLHWHSLMLRIKLIKKTPTVFCWGMGPMGKREAFQWKEKCGPFPALTVLTQLAMTKEIWWTSHKILNTLPLVLSSPSKVTQVPMYIFFWTAHFQTAKVTCNSLWRAARTELHQFTGLAGALGALTSAPRQAPQGKISTPCPAPLSAPCLAWASRSPVDPLTYFVQVWPEDRAGMLKNSILAQGAALVQYHVLPCAHTRAMLVHIRQLHGHVRQHTTT